MQLELKEKLFNGYLSIAIVLLLLFIVKVFIWDEILTEWCVLGISLSMWMDIFFKYKSLLKK